MPGKLIGNFHWVGGCKRLVMLPTTGTKMCRLNLHEGYEEHREVSDPIHGSVRLHPLLFKIIDTPQFQRLRNIKQLGCCYLVYPAAVHTRFEHSVGVCHLAGRFVWQLRSKHSELGITDKDQLCVMIAGLCHDLGHGPFSHVYDNTIVPALNPEKSKEWMHEKASVEMLDYLLRDNPHVAEALEEAEITSSDLKFIKECILGPKKPESDMDDTEWSEHYEGRPVEKSFLYDIVSNKKDGLDVDRYEYFLRDSAMLGVDNMVGKTTLDRLLMNTRVYKVGKNGRMRICYAARKIMNDLHSVGRTRFRLHDVAYQHKTAKSCELMLLDVFKNVGDLLKFKGDDGQEYVIANCMENMAAYTQLDDTVLTLIKHLDNSNDNQDGVERAKGLLRRMEKREIYTKVAAADLDMSQITREKLKEKKQDLVMEIAKEGIDPSKIRIYKAKKNFGMGEKLPLSLLLSYNHKNIMECPHLLDESEFPNDIPKHHDVLSLTVFFTDVLTEQKYHKINEGFKRWCLSVDSAENLAALATPIKIKKTASTFREDSARKRLKLDDGGGEREGMDVG